MDEPAVAIESLASGGAGVAHLPDGMTVFVPRTAPGDRVRLRDVRKHRRHAEAQIAEVVGPGPERVSPPCNHFVSDNCGGCQWQHLSAAAQHEAKRRIVGDALRRVGKLDVADPELVPSPRSLHYRTTITLTVRWRGAHPLVGFHDGADPDRVFMLDSCSIAREELGVLWTSVRPALTALPKGDDVRLKLRVLPDGSRHVMVDGGEGAWTGASRLSQAAGPSVTIWWQPTGGAPRRMAGADADPSSVAFEQVNAEVAVMMRQAVIEAAGDGPAKRLLDLYAGSGDTAVLLAQKGFEVAMVEQDTRAVRRAEERAMAAGVSVRCIAGRVEDHLAKVLPADAIVVNPPRAGLSEAVAARLSVSPSFRLIYVSCDPATLGRDLIRMRIAAKDIVLNRAYDMFPQTSHVETLLVARAGGGA